MMHVDNQTRTLLLTQGYEPIKIIPWQRAMTLLMLDKVEVVEEYDKAIRGTSMIVNVPAVVRLRKAFRRFAKPVKFSRVNIYARDEYRCQYCGTKCSIVQLTYDHVIPRSRGGLSTWENLVACCHPCNRRKGNHLPHEANMRPTREPRSFNLHTSRHIMRLMGHSDDKWRKYLFY